MRDLHSPEQMKELENALCRVLAAPLEDGVAEIVDFRRFLVVIRRDETPQVFQRQTNEVLRRRHVRQVTVHELCGRVT